MEWILDVAPTHHMLALGTALQEAAVLSVHIGMPLSPVRFRLDRTFTTLYRQNMGEGFLVETPFPIRRWEKEAQTGAFTCEIRIAGQYRTLCGQMRPAAVETLLQKTVPQAGPITIASPMTGIVLRIEIACGEKVQPGRVLAVLDAMKMENQILCKQLGTIDKIHISPGRNVQKGSPLFTLLTR